MNNEDIVLSYFFTNIDSNVYCATDNMPISLWALLLGGYSRSSESLRNRLLNVFKDVANENNIEYNEYITKLAENISNNSIDLHQSLVNAEKFMAKWAVEYGHNSLKDSSFNMIAIEGVSIKASKILEDSKQGAFQEKSTRYMDFSGDSISQYVDNIQGKELLNEAMKIYGITKNRLIEYYKTKINRDDFKTENAWIRTATAKAFDDARYLLPTSIKTSLGVTMTTRETERWISKLLASEYLEIREIGEKIKTECQKITPALIKHVTPNTYLNRRFSGISKLIKTKIDNILPSSDNMTNLITHSDIESEVFYNILTASGIIEQDSLLETIKNTPSICDEIINLCFSERGSHDELPEELSTGHLHFEIVCDIGAFRDIQRHRRGTQVVEKWNAFRGYAIPPVLNEEGLEDIKEKYIEIFERISIFNKKLTLEDVGDSEYYLLLGHNVKFSYICDFKQFVYLVELRSGESGHYSYRKIAQDMFKEFEGEFPRLAKHIRINMSGYSDRRKAEEVIQEKITKIQSNS